MAVFIMDSRDILVPIGMDTLCFIHGGLENPAYRYVAEAFRYIFEREIWIPYVLSMRGWETLPIDIDGGIYYG
jgi:hypothetical protein